MHRQCRLTIGGKAVGAGIAPDIAAVAAISDAERPRGWRIDRGGSLFFCNASLIER